MKKSIRLTTAQFAKLHHVNKRTLHYYDNIGLFSPSTKGENQYRYYDSSQSIDFEFILMLKELNMSIDEIKAYVNNPNPDDFMKIINEKSAEIEQQMKKLKQTQKLLFAKRAQIELCDHEANGTIQVMEREEERFLTIPYTFENDDVQEAFSHIRDVWGIEQCRAGIGSYIAIEKIFNNDFQKYDGLFTPMLNTKKSHNVMIKPKGQYLCTYMKGTWNKLPETYQRMVCYVKEHHLKLTGYAYERGMNDFVIKNEEEYITEIAIKIQQDC